MNVSDSLQRRNSILEAIIEAYLPTAMPVGSELIARKLRLTLSPATIRHIMGELERAGLLEQPHTSAGRVPTEEGYRYYVRGLMDVRWLSPEQVVHLHQLLQEAEVSLERLMDRVREVLAELTHQAAFVVSPTLQQGTVRQIELVPLGLRKLLCVLVANPEDVFASHVVELEEPISRDEVTALIRFINTQLVGLPFGDVLRLLERRLLAETDSFYHLVKRSRQILQQALATGFPERLTFEGTSAVVAQPEFQKDPEKAHQLLKGLESQQALIEQLRQDLASQRLQVRIGRELFLTGCEECSYVMAPCIVNGQVVGGVGVLGPKRMDYPRISALVEGMARCLGSYFAHEREDE